MEGANQALSYIVFKRDVHLFLKKYPQLELVEQKVFSNYLRYLLSGGLNFRQILPSYGTSHQTNRMVVSSTQAFGRAASCGSHSQKTKRIA